MQYGNFNMTKSACDLMKKSAVLALGFAGAGALFLLMLQLFATGSLISVILWYLAFFSIVAGVLVMVITAFAVLLPPVNRRLELCRR